MVEAVWNSWKEFSKKKWSRFFFRLWGSSCLLCHQRLTPSDLFALRTQLPLCQECYQALQREKLAASFTKEGYEVIALFEYQGLAKRLIHQAKYHHCLLSATILIELANDFFLSERQATPFFLIPIPCSYKSQRERGWDPVTVWAKAIQKRLPEVQVIPLLKRRSSQLFQPQQKKLNRQERIQLARFRYQLDPKRLKESQLFFEKESLTPKSFILLDDVMTTGATIKEAMELLTPFSPTAWVLFVD